MAPVAAVRWTRVEGCEAVRSLRDAEAEAEEALPVAGANVAAQRVHTPGRTQSWEASRPDLGREAGVADFETAVGVRGEVEVDGRVVAVGNVAGVEGEGCLESPVPFVTLECEAVVVVAVGECPRRHTWTRSRRNP